MKLYKTTITLTVLSADETPSDYGTLENVLNAATEGSLSAVSEWMKSEEITREEFENACWEQGTDPDFFFMENA